MQKTSFWYASLFCALLLADAATAQQPDYTFTTQVTQDQGMFTVEKVVEVYLDGNPGEPGPTCVPNDGLQCYVYTVENLSGSVVGINEFTISLEVPTCDPHTIGFNPGPKDPASATISGGAEWTFDPPLGGLLGTSTPEKSSQLILMSPCAPGPMDTTVASFAGAFAFDANSQCLGPFEPIACELMLEKFCNVDKPGGGGGSECPPGPGSGADCQGKVRRMVFEYTGAACDPNGHQQGSKATCTGDPAGQEPVEVKGDGDTTVAPAGESVGIGDLVAVTQDDGGTFPSNTGLWIKKGGSPIQDLSIHTSCSQPLNVGDRFGALTLRELTTTEGGTVRSSSPEADAPTNVCSIAVLPPGTQCRSKPEAITLRYVGGDCTATQDQEGTFQCTGDAGTTEPVRIQLRDKDCNVLHFDTGTPADVDLGDVFNANPLGGFESNTCFQVYDGLDLLLQESVIHTSCSKPLRTGDRFGAVQVVGFDGKGQGEFVDYTYVATEKDGQAVSNVTIEDDVYGTVTSGDSIPAGGELRITVTQWIDESTENTATLSGTVMGQQCVDDTAVATVEAETIDIPTKKKQQKGKKKNKKRSSKKRAKKAMKKTH